MKRICDSFSHDGAQILGSKCGLTRGSWALFQKTCPSASSLPPRISMYPGAVSRPSTRQFDSHSGLLPLSSLPLPLALEFVTCNAAASQGSEPVGWAQRSCTRSWSAACANGVRSGVCCLITTSASRTAALGYAQSSALEKHLLQHGYPRSHLLFALTHCLQLFLRVEDM